MNQNENPMFPWDSSILPTAVPPFRETVTDSFLWCRRKEEAVQRPQPPLFYLFRFSFCLFLNLIPAILHHQLAEHRIRPGEPLSGVNGRIIYENTLVHQSCTAVGCHQFVDHLMFLHLSRCGQSLEGFGDVTYVANRCVRASDTGKLRSCIIERVCLA